MQRQFTIWAACAALVVGGIAILSARADDPNRPADQTTNQPADRTTDTHRDMARPQSPAAKEVRDTVAEATSAAVQGKFSDVKERFTSEDRKRLGDSFKDNQTLRGRWTQFARDWKAKNNPALDIEVDGGINPETARVSIENGANVLVAGTSIFRTDDYAKAIRDLGGE